MRGGPAGVWAERPGRGGGPCELLGHGLERAGLKKEKERGRQEGFGFFNSFQTLFFKLCKLHSNDKTMHSNYDAQALIDSKIIKMILNI
jgi:hypothetical protein